ncbi:hypothetical protein [Flavobacterium sp.]|uniref:hypothetical protein n=1 Tax=Flavobacterium sp. TaxID=239 RepID=UPI0008D31257|nr:hypothetical protein [Flavobacterium sp.]OGS60661.1 MAG: hypothetical protein A2X07_00960 [Flavobacteria bacterium GWF1_32_7]HBD26184.1 hypothetical protein [Flavobacterium sp.]
MKNTVKLFGLLMVSVVLFSCSTDEQDEDLERAIKLSENMQQMQAREGDESQSDTIKEEEIQIDDIAKEDGTPLVVIKRD